MEEYSAVADAINEANSLAEKTAGSRNSTRAGGRGGGWSDGSNRGRTPAATGAGGTGVGGRTNNHRGGEGDSDTEGRGEGVSAGSRGASGGGGQPGSVAVRSRASGGRAGVAAAGVTGGGGSSTDSKDAASYTIARHVADFGNVVVGFTKTKVFRVANTGKLGPLSWSFNKNALAGSGYSIEPEKVVRLPEGASATFSASFQARQAALVD